MDRYWVSRGGDPGKWGAYHVIDRSSAKNIATVYDPETAQRIADLLNGEDRLLRDLDAVAKVTP